MEGSREGRVTDAYMVASLTRTKKLPALDQLIKRKSPVGERMNELKSILGARKAKNG
jgi:hypothetical protein